MTVTTPSPYRNPNLSPEARTDDLIDRMTLEEKVAQLSAAWLNEVLDGETFAPAKAQTRLGLGIGEITRPAGGGYLAPAEVARATADVQTYLAAETRLGIPAIVHDECCSGFMARGATVFPQMIGLASTWEPALAEAMTSVIRGQMRAVGVQHGLAPVLDVTRDPRWGRVEETFGEDPYLAACLGTAYVRGLQGPDLRRGVAATGKHFAGHGMPEGGLNWSGVHVGWRELREVFLFPFEAAVKEAGLATMMNAYHELDGIPCGASHELLTEILREAWGFGGVVVSDYDTLPRLVDYHHVAADQSEAAAIALAAGLDVELSRTEVYGEPLLQAIRAGQIDPAIVDRAVRRVLRLKFRLGLFDAPPAGPAEAEKAFGQPEQRDLARRIAQQSLVLLKNDGELLPLRPDLGAIAVIGPNADVTRHLVGDYAFASMVDFLDGGYKPPETTRYPEKLPPMTTVLGAIRQRVAPGTTVHYAPGCDIVDHSRAGFAEAVAAARASQVAVLVLGGRSGLVADSTCGECRDRASLGLPGVQEALAQAVLETGTPVVLVLVDGRPPAIPELAERIPAILEAWLPGQEGGPAVAQALFGDVNPGGKLPITVPRSVGQVPIYYAHKPASGRSYPFNDYVELSARPLFAFGHGLSYTSFEYSGLEIAPPRARAADEVEIRVTVKNIGERAGDEVVQLYLHDPVASVARPVKELKGFRRVALVPGQGAQVTFHLPVAQLAFHDRSQQYVVEPGTIEVLVGSASDDIRLSGQFEIVGPVTPIHPKVFFGRSAAAFI